jgi:Txe/YoeB family toxin of toxin-antitoxin system
VVGAIRLQKALRLIRLVQETQQDPFGGIGKPEPLKYELAGCWSKRIDQEHRLVYQVFEDKIRITGLPLSLLTKAPHLRNRGAFVCRVAFRTGKLALCLPHSTRSKSTA